MALLGSAKCQKVRRSAKGEAQKKTRVGGAYRLLVALRDSEVLQIREFDTVSTAVPTKIPYAEKGIHTPDSSGTFSHPMGLVRRSAELSTSAS